MQAVLNWLNRRAENVMAVLLGVMFITFIIQIVTRYISQYGIAADFPWTSELCTACWLWAIFWGGAFLLNEPDHVKFDMLYNLFSPRIRWAMSLFTSLAIAIVFALSLPAVWKWIAFLFKIGKTASTLRNPFTGELVPLYLIYSVYLAFALGMIVRYALRALRLILGATPESLDAAPASHAEFAAAHGPVSS